MIVKYVNMPNNAKCDVESTQRHIKYLQGLKMAIDNDIMKLQSKLTDVSFIHSARVIEIDKELTSDPDNYCIKAKQLNNDKIVYLTKSQLRK